MIKIEKLKDGAKVYVTRDGVKTQVFLNQLISHSEFETAVVEGGTLVYSIDELEVKEMSGTGKQIELNLSETVQDVVLATETATPVVTEAVVQTPVEVTTTVAPVIVKPAPRAKK